MARVARYFPLQSAVCSAIVLAGVEAFSGGPSAVYEAIAGGPDTARSGACLTQVPPPAPRPLVRLESVQRVKIVRMTMTHNRNQTRGFTLAQKLAHYSIPEPNSGCLLWLGGTRRDGYGILDWNGKKTGTHRLAWENRYGPIPPKMVVCHKCDVPACINTDHLFLGTQAENIADRDAKGRGRQPAGEAHGRTRLSTAAVESIRASRLSSTALAKIHGVSDRHIRSIRSLEYRRAG